MDKDFDILISWKENAEEWIRLLSEDGIASRKITNKTIVEIIQNENPEKILDLGCGEGWLTRAIATDKNTVVGIDATEKLLINARKKSDHSYYRMTYNEIVEGKSIPEEPFDAIVLNFCLYENEEVGRLLKSLGKYLAENGLIFIQSIHPYFLIQNKRSYKSQWIEDSWKGLKGNFVYPHSWYARTMEDWIKMFEQSHLSLISIKEPLDKSNLPVSIIFTLRNK